MIYLVAVLLIGFAFLSAAIIFYQIGKMAEYLICVWCKRIPFVPSARVLRDAVVREISEHYPTAHSIVEIGSGYGALARRIARECDADVVGLENMPMTAMIAKIGNWRPRSRARTVWCDAFEYLARRGRRFDVAVAYLGPGVNDELAKYAHRFRVLITLDVPIAGIAPTRVTDVGHGHTSYGRTRFPHKLFIYEFNYNLFPKG